MQSSTRPILAASACVLLAVAWRFQDARFESIPVGDGLYMVTSGMGGNVAACVGDDGLLVIDDQFERTAPELLEALKALSDGPIEFLINTHFHGDHTGANPILGKAATILAHDNVRRRLAAPGSDGSLPSQAMLADGLPDLTYSEALTLHWNGETIRAEHYPAGHTDGDTVVFFERAHAVHMGDLFFSGRFPFIDLEGGGSLDGLIAAVEAILGRIDAETKILPGHGPLSSKADLEAYLKMLRDSRERVLAALADKKSAQQMKDEQLLADYASWSWNFISAERFIDTLVADLR